MNSIGQVMIKAILAILLLICFLPGASQVISFNMYDDVIITLDKPENYSSKRKTQVIFFALPNGNTTAQTMGKKLAPGDDWHFDIQHIRAQTHYIRNELPKENIVVVYLENTYKSWPSWKSKNSDHIEKVRHILDTITPLFKSKKTTIALNGHSGGGRFVFSCLDGFESLPSNITNITFLDSDYGYESRYAPLLLKWLKQNKNARLNVFAYNDSVALYEGKRVVSDTGGTWTRSHMMMHDLASLNFVKLQDDSLIVYKSSMDQVHFYFKTNPDKNIFHTHQVELNGFIHSILLGTKKEEKGYKYFGARVYSSYIH